MVLLHMSSEVALMPYGLFTMLTLKLTIIAFSRNLYWTWFSFRLFGVKMVFLNMSSEVVSVDDGLFTELTMIEVIVPLFWNHDNFCWFLPPFLLPHMISDMLVEIRNNLKLAFALETNQILRCHIWFWFLNL